LKGNVLFELLKLWAEIRPRPFEKLLEHLEAVRLGRQPAPRQQVGYIEYPQNHTREVRRDNVRDVYVS